MIRTYIESNLFSLLKFGFSINELKDFCLGEPYFREFLDNEVPNEGFKRELLRYALRRIEPVDALLNWVKEINPVRYANHGPYLSEYTQSVRADMVESYNLTRNKLIQLFNLDSKYPEITLYISRHSTATHLPEIVVSQENEPENVALERIKNYQVAEAKYLAGTQKTDSRAFAVVSAIELIEAHRLMSEIDKSNLLDWFSSKQREQLPDRIRVKLDVCPESDQYEKILGRKSTVFIGGPRANLGSYFYLFGMEAGEMRPKRVPANVIETITNPEDIIACGPERNLGLIQKHTIIEENHTVLYLAGTGVNGTAAASAYLRMHWLDLLEEFRDENFCRVIEVDKRREEDVAMYTSTDWNDDDWSIRK